MHNITRSRLCLEHVLLWVKYKRGRDVSKQLVIQFEIKEIRYANYRVAVGLLVGYGKREKVNGVAIGMFAQTMFLSIYS